MGHWNYRIVKTTLEFSLNGEPATEDTYSYHEAHYNNAGELIAITQNAITISSSEETHESRMKELSATLDRMRLALDKPVIDGDNFIPEGQWDSESQDEC